MAQQPAATAAYEELIRRFSAAVRATQLYAPDHPLVTRSIAEWIAAITLLHSQHSSVSFGIIDAQLVVADAPLPRLSAAMPDLIARLVAHRIERISLDRGVTPAEIGAFVVAIASLGGHAAGPVGEALSSDHIRVGAITPDDRLAGGLPRDMAGMRELYSQSVAAAEAVWESAQVEGRPDMVALRRTVEGLTEAVTDNRGALIALTALHSHDDYTFTHMVNVSILTMGQARGLGVEGRLLRELGLSALMHDIGKVRTPKEILQKPDKLTDEEFVVMRRHVVDGAEMLRHTPEMPTLAPIVAFEHHLRLDGSGYPLGITRPAINLGTMLCSIADVYDAMRSQRVYQQAFSTDRILAVLKRAEGMQFDQHLIRRFVQLLGIYQAGTLVRLDSGEVAVVTEVHAPDPYRPRVRLLFDADSAPIERVVERSLWLDSKRGPTQPAGPIVAVLDPGPYGVDPLAYVPTHAA